MISQTKPRDIPALTGLRFFAAFAIVCHHLTLNLYHDIPSPSWRSFLGTLGLLGMSLFFVMSGFIIHYNYFENLRSLKFKSNYNFLVARFARLYPLFICLVAVDIGLALFHGTYNIKRSEAIPYFFTLSQSWFYKLLGNVPIHIPFSHANITWSISSEFFLYLLFPMLVFVFLKIRHATQARYIFGISLLLQVLITQVFKHYQTDIEAFSLERFGPASVGTYNPGVYSFYTWLSFNSPYVRFFEFFIGAAISHLWKAEGFQIKATSIYISAATLLGIFIILSNSWTHVLPMDFVQTWSYSPLIGLFIYGLVSSPVSGLQKLLSYNPFVFLGEMSYSIYMVHLYVFSNFNSAPLGNNQDLYYLQSGLKAIHASVILFLISYVTFQYIEVPARKYLRTRLTIY